MLALFLKWGSIVQFYWGGEGEDWGVFIKEASFALVVLLMICIKVQKRKMRPRINMCYNL